MAKTSELNIKVLIMSGGRGTRMWPISNISHPKQFEGFLGKKSMFRETIERALKGFSKNDIYIATNKNFAKHLKKQAPEIPEKNFILEPAMRDNLGAVALATSFIHHRHPNSVVVYLWGADHLVQDVDKFIKVLKLAAKKAQETNKIVFVDAKPTYPTVHNGWMKLGKEVDKVNGFKVYQLIRQVEKPNLETAKKFFKSKRYAIHTGYMAVNSRVMLDYYQEYAPKTYKTTQKIAKVFDQPGFKKTLEAEYPKYQKTSVDYGLLEKLPDGSQLDVMADFGWIDVGTWELLYHGLPKDENGNITKGKCRLIDTKNSLVISQKSKVAGVVGLSGVVVVDTPHGLLVCSLDKAPLVKQLYKQVNKK